MLSKAKTLQGYKLDSLDGEFGEVKEFYFDDQHWTIRYLVADTGNWLSGRQVLISPHALTAASKVEKHIAVNLTRKQIEGGPALNSDKPVSHQFEEAYYDYYGWPMYWDGPHMWGTYPFIVRGDTERVKRAPGEKVWDPNLRSTQTVTGYYIEAEDGTIGHVEDFIIDDETWAIRYMVVDTKNWWPGKKVLISPRWIDRVSWDESKVFVRLSREAVQQAPEYSNASMLTREYEEGLHGHYKRPGYWSKEPTS
ncbi:MAG: PRC-barrel domain-containing protein [Desulfuromonadales bacterium]|nr:PRC-barrel domain-containing protein [Desulfuromonadales bacterium]